MILLKNNAYLLIALLSASSFFISCKDKSSKDPQTITSGNISIVVDETLAPIIQDQLAIFESTYSDASIELIERPEKLAINHLLSDSSKVAVLSRKLTPEEEKFFESKKIVPRTTRFAIDGIAVITNKSNPRSEIHIEELFKVLRGEPSSVTSLVFDNPNSSSIRLLKELAGVDSLPQSGVYALKTNTDIIEYVHENSQAIGVIGINWLVQPAKEFSDMVEEIKVLGVKNLAGRNGDDGFYYPSQDNLALGQYPLARELYIVNVTGARGLGFGFGSFVGGERGQRLVLKSGLLPDSIPPREIIIRK